MREILFRGKDIAGNWHYGDFEYYTDDFVKIVNHSQQEHGKKVERETIGQYTGLPDKNSNKIFEGDIVKGKFGTGMVNYNNGCFCIKGYPYKSYFNNPAIDVVMNEDCIEIIGNIHDNSELLKEAEQE